MLAVIVAIPDHDGAPALDEPFCGLPLLLRAVLVAQQQGADRIVVAVRPESEPRAVHVRADRRVLHPVELLAADSDDAALAEKPDLVLRYDRVCGVDVGTAAGKREAKRLLFEACRKPVDGFVSRHLNRHVSIFVSKLLVATPITPNAMTVATFSLAIFAAAFAVQGGYWPTLAAAFLMQWNSILDGCDGELARVRHQGSKLGQWLDTVGDDASNVIFWAALGLGARGIPGVGGWLALAGYAAAVANGLAALCNYAVLASLGSGDFYALTGPPKKRAGVAGAVVAFFEVILKQDFFLFLMLVVAALGVIHHALVAVALGAIITLASSAARAARYFMRK